MPNGRRKKTKVKGCKTRKKRRRKEEKNMKRDEIKAIFPDATAEQLQSIMDLNGADVEKAKAKTTDAEAKLEKKQEELDKALEEAKKLKESNATAEDWKKKFDDLEKSIAEEKKQAEADRKAKEKADRIAERFNAVLGDKKFNHGAIKADYLAKFGKALEEKENEGKSDADIFHALTKDDAQAFVGVTVKEMPGGASGKSSKGANITREEISKMKDGAARRKAMMDNPALFPELSNNNN